MYLNQSMKNISSNIMNFKIFIFILVFSICCRSADGQIQTLNGSPIKAAELDKFLQSQMEEHKIPGLSIAIIHEGKVVYNQALGVTNRETSEKVSKTTLFEAASMSKPVFAYFVMKMVEKGLLDLDTPLYTYLPYPDIAHDERYKLITARMVLTHTSGFVNWRFHNDDGKLNILFTPGTQVAYSGEGFEYLAQVIAHLNGRSMQNLDELFQQEVAKPLGMKHSYFTKNDYLVKHKAKGHSEGKVIEALYENDLMTFGAAHSLHSNATDFSRFLLAIMEEKGLKKENFHELLKEQVRLSDNHEYREELGIDAWGLGFIRSNTPHGVKLFHGGTNPYFQSYFSMLKDKKWGFVIFTNADNGLAILEPLEQYLINDEKIAK